MKKVLLPMVIALLAAAGAVVYFYFKSEEKPVRFSGELETETVSVSFRVPGQIETTYFKEGDKVTEGDLLAQLDPSEYEYALKLAESEMRGARAGLAEAEAGEGPEKIVRERIERAKAALDAAEAAVEIAKKRVGFTKLYSPLNGRITYEYRSVGEYVQPGAPVASVSDPENMWLRAYLPENKAREVKVGDLMKITADGMPDKTFEGIVTYISDSPEFTPKQIRTDEERVKLVYKMKITIRNPEGVLKPGLPADAVPLS